MLLTTSRESALWYNSTYKYYNISGGIMAIRQPQLNSDGLILLLYHVVHTDSELDVLYQHLTFYCIVCCY